MNGKYWVQILGPNGKILSVQTSSTFKYQIYHRTTVWTELFDISDCDFHEGLHLSFLNNHLAVHLNQRWLLKGLHFILDVRLVFFFFSTKNLFSAVGRKQLWSPPRSEKKNGLGWRKGLRGWKCMFWRLARVKICFVAWRLSGSWKV